MLRPAATTAAAVLVGALAPAAYADGPGGGGSSGSSGSSGGQAGGDPASTGSSKPTDKCSYDLVTPPPPPGHLAWKGHDLKDGGVYKVQCDSGSGGVVFVPNSEDGPAAPVIDPEVVARRAAASMRLKVVAEGRVWAGRDDV
ncbi:hypothetical protein [Streptomyces sp. NPDC060022]|uniref:hypothetical protein n=1 Tax=Streptomyces sp. NPDC060022 TaxID=3347039 RepID=UPI0036A066A7